MGKYLGRDGHPLPIISGLKNELALVPQDKRIFSPVLLRHHNFSLSVTTEERGWELTDMCK